jgi:hypothetical protein
MLTTRVASPFAEKSAPTGPGCSAVQWAPQRSEFMPPTSAGAFGVDKSDPTRWLARAVLLS